MTASRRVGHDFLTPRATNGATQHNGDHYAGNVYQNFNQVDTDPLDLLPAVYIASFDAASRQNDPLCLEDTRVEILERIVSWSNCASNDRPIFWLSGMAGTGKSTIARTIALKFQEEERVFASFFFARDNAASVSARDFFTTIAKQLATSGDPALREKICAAIQNNSDIAHKAQRLQWQRLVLKPLTQLHEECQTLRDRRLAVIVIDALDECDRQDDIREILRIICGCRGLDPARLRIIITSRPETPIRLGFEDMPHILHQTLSLDDVSHEIVNADLTVFFNHWLKDVRRRHGGLSTDWPGADSVASLVAKCEGLFIYAATLSLFLLQKPQLCNERLNRIMEEDQVSSNTYLEPLDRMYLTILRVSIDDTSALSDHEREILQERFDHVVGSIVVLQDGISAEALALLLRMPTMNVAGTLHNLHSVIRYFQDGRAIRLLHESFREFITDPQRCTEPRFYVDSKRAHEKLLNDCLETLKVHLKQDVCNARDPAATIEELQPNAASQRCQLLPHVQYACSNWHEHGQKSGLDLGNHGQLSEFFYTHFLHWIEAMCWMGKLAKAVGCVSTLLESPTLESRLERFLQDAKRFLVLHGGTIAAYPLQIYSSALIFSPRNSLVRREFSLETSDWLAKYHPARGEWDSCLFESEGLFPTAFSPDGTLLAFASSSEGRPNRDLQVWNVDYGALVYSIPLSAGLSSVAFNPTATYVAFSVADGSSKPVRSDTASEGSGSTDLDQGMDSIYIRLWNLATDSIDHVLRGHAEEVQRIVFSPDGTLLASTSSDHIAKIWEVFSRSLRCTLVGESAFPEISFSSDSNMVASLVDNSTLRIWDRRNDRTESVVAFKEVGSFSEEASLAFAPDGHLYAAKGSCVVICDVYQPAIQRKVELMDLDIGFSGNLRNNFSSDASILAVHAAEEQKVYLWQTADLSLCSVVSAVSAPVGCKFELSTDGACIAIWDSTTIRVFEVASGNERVVLNGGCIEEIKFAPHANTIASGSRWYGTITVWDLSQTASPKNTSVTEHVHHITVSIDKTSIVFTSSTSDSRKTSLNLIKFGQDHEPPSIKCVEYEYPFGKVQLLPGSQLAFVSADVGEKHATGYLLDSAAWAPTPIPPCETLTVSPSGFYLALAGLDHRIHIRHTSMQDFTVCLTGHRTAIQMIQFSPSDKQLVSVSNDGQVLLWDTEGQSAPVLLEYEYGPGQEIGRIGEGVFSADEKMLACAYWNFPAVISVQLWNLGTGERSRGLDFFDFSPCIIITRTLSFSPDGRYLRTAEKTFDLSESPTASLDLGTPMIVDPLNVLWMSWHGKRVLKLPEGYKHEQYYSHENILAIGCREGGVAFLEFDPQKLREALGI
ncbi:hypothetical protein D6C86_09855 [Aureobasidium pullulans]|uniref:Nephrocystin 3-like N-terminal domain-containing protein n=1 Tax=Aureobasidium pullulans TaxID=5580 RepID=A0A4S9PEX1_AURPU|nr:hypothetical protein D6C94_10239 [Aureobasidium pullulans]THZ38814.1 hypothetical protein D6C87_07543 [Aureobasidium pullulans]THZ53439.1 hypothetical protein D6C86_09855 [Aureobasidium pullulans]